MPEQFQVSQTVTVFSPQEMLKNFQDLNTKQRGMVYGLFGFIIIFVLLAMSVYIASIHVIVNADSNHEDVNYHLFMYVYVGLFAALVVAIATSKMEGGNATNGLYSLYSLSVLISMIVLVRNDLRPNAESMDLSLTELDFIEYGTYAQFGGSVLLVAGVWYNMDTFGKILGYDDKK